MTPRMKPLTIQQAPHVCYGVCRVSSTLRQLKNYLPKASDLSAALRYKALGVLKFCCKLINVSHSAFRNVAAFCFRRSWDRPCSYFCLVRKL